MTAKSIIEIDVQDQAFKDFQGLFARFQDSLAGLPGAWSQLNKAVSVTKTPLKEIENTVDSTTSKIEEAGQAQEKVNGKLGIAIKAIGANLSGVKAAQDKVKVSADGTAKNFKGMSKDSGTLAKNLKDVTLSLLKWGSLTGVFSGLLGGGGLFGLERLGASASNSRRESQGLGVKPGDLSAARTNYQKFVDVDSVLSKINEAKYDVTKRSAFPAAGLNAGDWEKQDAGQILEKLIPQIKDKFQQVGGTKQAADATGLTQFVGMDDLMRLKAVTHAEIEAATASYEADKKSLSVSDETQRSWQDMTIQLNRAGKQIENSLIQTLVGLADPISRLSKAAASAVEVFLKSPRIGEWIDALGVQLKKFATFLTSDDLPEMIKNVLDALDTFGGALYSLAKFIGKFTSIGNEQGLKASQYRKLEELHAINPALADELEHKLKNPNASKEVGFFSGKSSAENFTQLLAKASQGPDAAKINALVKALDDNTAATVASAPVPVADRVASQINLAKIRTPGLKEEAERQRAEAMKYAADPIAAKYLIASTPTGSSAPPGSPDIAALAQAEQDKYGIPAEVTLAQYKLESNNGKRMPAGSNNPFGIKAQKGKPYVESETTEVINGVTEHLTQRFRKFDSIQDAFEEHARLLATNPVYEKARKVENDPKAFADALTGSYATDPNYGKKLKAVIDELRASKTETTAPTPATSQNTGTASNSTPSRTISQPQPVNVTIHKAAGADVYTTVNGLGYAS